MFCIWGVRKGEERSWDLTVLGSTLCNYLGYEIVGPMNVSVGGEDGKFFLFCVVNGDTGEDLFTSWEKGVLGFCWLIEVRG